MGNAHPTNQKDLRSYKILDNIRLKLMAGSKVKCNISDEQIRACAATGGVVCVSGVSIFLGTRTPTADDVARHAAYVADLVGVQHAGIGLDISFRQDALNDNPPGDYDPAYWWPESAGYRRAIEGITYTPVATWQLLAQALQRVGMTPGEAAGVMGQNMVRVAGQVWARGTAS